MDIVILFGEGDLLMKRLVGSRVHVGVDVLLYLVDQSLIKIGRVVEVLDRPLVLLPAHAVCLDDLCELLGQRAEVIGEDTYSKDHHYISDNQLVVVSRDNVTIADSHDCGSPPVHVVDISN